MTAYENDLELYNEYLGIYFHEYKALSDAQKRNVSSEYDPVNLLLETYKYNFWFEMKNRLIKLQEKVVKKNL